MSDQYCQTVEPICDLKKCPQCDEEIIQDIFQLPKNEGRKKGRLIEARACDNCKIIYEIIS